MEDLGAYLKKLREEKNISYDQIYEDLRLREEQVRLMEENRFAEIGYIGFARAMVFNYARYLEADLDEVMQKFNLLMPENIKKVEPETQEAGKKDFTLSKSLLDYRYYINSCYSGSNIMACS